MVSRRYRLFIILLIIAVCSAVAVVWLSREKPVKVLVAEVSAGSVQDTVSNTRVGTIKACRRAGISPSIGGQIDALPVKEGDVVKKGDLLMALWNEDVKARLKLAKSEAIASKARASQICVLAKVAQREADRQLKLKKGSLASEQVIEKAVGDAHAQAAACDAAKASAQASLAQIDVAQAALDKTQLTAPFDGVVAEVNGEIGEIVTPSPVGIPTPPAIDLMDTSCLYVSAPIDEVDAPRIKLNMPAKITLDAYSGKVFDGVVRRIAPYVLEAEKQARTVDVEVNFVCQQDCAGMLPGYSADIEVIVAEKKNVLRVPTEAVLEGNSVLVLGDDGVLHERKIKTGLSNWSWTQVTGGLKKGDVVVVSVERDGVKDGAPAIRETSKSAT
jgi:HlyD family secretion protein